MIRLTKTGRGTRNRTASRFLPIGMLAGPAGSIVTALLSNWKLAIFGILLAVMGYQNFMSFEILRPFGLRTVPGVLQDVKKAENQAAIVAEQYAECEVGREILKQKIADTNALIQQWSDASAQQQATLDQLGNTLQQLQEQSKAELEIIISGPIPQTCEGAFKLLRESAGELTWENH